MFYFANRASLANCSTLKSVDSVPVNGQKLVLFLGSSNVSVLFCSICEGLDSPYNFLSRALLYSSFSYASSSYNLRKTF